ncbi:MAG: Tetratricopeptide repeat [Chloroflexota bacterium]
MSDTSSPETGERTKRIIGILIAVVTLITTVIAFVQSDAGARDDQANRDSKRYSTEALGRKVSGDARVNYDFGAAYQSWYELDLLASAAEGRGDAELAASYSTARDELVRHSPLLAPPYFDPETGVADVARYEADTYLVEITALTERFNAASAVKDAWDFKANTYIVHLTLLAVSLFLLGLAATISSRLPQLVFSVAGVGITTVVVVWATSIYLQPVYDLRAQGGAIDAYARGVGLAHQERWQEALAAYDEALAAAPGYATALTQRAEAKAALGDLQAAALDYEQARAAGEGRAFVAGNLAWIYYLLGRHDDAVAMNRVALETSPDELWIQFDMGLALLASGQNDAAAEAYRAGMDRAAAKVAEAKAAGNEPPSDLWWSLDDAAASLDDLIAVMDTDGETQPPRDKIADPATIRPVAEELITNLKSLSVSLEYRGTPPQGTPEGSVGAITFATVDEQGDAAEQAESFPAGTSEVGALFDYDGLRDGQDVLFKVYLNGEEDPSWRLIQTWDLGASGTAQKLLSPGYTDTFVFEPGFYEVEIYVDGHLAQRGAFAVEE